MLIFPQRSFSNAAEMAACPLSTEPGTSLGSPAAFDQGPLAEKKTKMSRWGVRRCLETVPVSTMGFLNVFEV